MADQRMTRCRSFRRSAAVVVSCAVALGGCIVTEPSKPSPSTSGPISASQTAADAAAAIAAVGTLPGVVSTELSFSPARFGYPSTIFGTLQVTAHADPVAVLDRALFQLYRDARVDSYQVMTERDGMLWDTENLGLSRSEDYSGLVGRYGQVTPGQSFPTPAPPRPAPTSRPVPVSALTGATPS